MSTFIRLAFRRCMVLPLGNKFNKVYRLNSKSSFWSSANNTMNAQIPVSTGWKVFVTRRVPPTSIDLLKSGGCTVTQWDSDAPIPKKELLEGVRGCDGLFCLLTDRIDKEILDSAGLLC